MEKVIDTLNTLALVATEEYAAKGRGQPTKDKMAHEAYLQGLRDAKAVVEDAMGELKEDVEAMANPAPEPVPPVNEEKKDGVQTETKAKT